MVLDDIGLVEDGIDSDSASDLQVREDQIIRRCHEPEPTVPSPLDTGSNIQILDESFTSFHPDFRSIRHHGCLYLLPLSWVLIRALICRVSCFRLGDGITVCVSTLQGFHLIVTVFANDQTLCPTKLRAHQVRFQVHRRLNINFSVISKCLFHPHVQLLGLFFD